MKNLNYYFIFFVLLIFVAATAYPMEKVEKKANQNKNQYEKQDGKKCTKKRQKERKVTGKKGESYLGGLLEKNKQAKIRPIQKDPRILDMEEDIKVIEEEQEKHKRFKKNFGANTFAKYVAIAKKIPDYHFVSIFLRRKKYTKGDTVQELYEQLKGVYEIDFNKSSKKSRLLQVYKNMHLLRTCILQQEKSNNFTRMSEYFELAKQIKGEIPKWVERHEKQSSTQKLLRVVKFLKSRIEKDYEILKDKEKIYNERNRLKIISAKIDKKLKEVEALKDKLLQDNSLIEDNNLLDKDGFIKDGFLTV